MQTYSARALLLVLLCSASLTAQHGMVQLEQTLGSGLQQNPQPAGALVWSHLVTIPSANSIQLKFAEVELGSEDKIIVTSVLDGHRMELDLGVLKNFQNHTAWFNGESVEVSLFLAPGSTGSVELDSVFADTGALIPETICGPTDDRSVTTDDRTCRVVPSTNSSCSYLGPCAASAWRVANGTAIATARHVAILSFFTIAEFNSPASNASNGAIVHPGPADQFPILTGTIQQSAATTIGDDWAVASVGTNSSGQTMYDRYGRGFLTGTTLPAINTTLRITGNGIDNTPDLTRHHRTQTHTGPFTSVTGTRLQYQVDTVNGNSGSAVQNTLTGEVIGIHTNAGCGATSGSNSGTSITNAGLQTALTNLGACQSLNLVSGNSELIAPCASAQFNFTPGTSRWNVVGVSGASDWDVILDGTASAFGGTSCDFLLSDGNAGATPTNFPGWMYRFSGTGDARGAFDAATTITLNRSSSVFFSSTDILEAVQFEVTTAGSYDITVDGTAANGVRWSLFQPTGDADWFRRGSNAVASGTVGGAPGVVTLSAGWHCLVLFRDNGSSGTSESVWVNVCDSVPALSLSSGSPTTITEECRRFDITPSANRWNIVGVSGSVDWDVIMGAAEARSGGSACDFVIADGRNGTIAPTSGTFNRFGSGADTATVKHEVASSMSLNNDVLGSISTSNILEAYEFNVTTTGNHIVTVVGDSSLRWSIFRPAANGDWQQDATDVTASGVGGGNVTVNLNVTGTWCIAIYSDGGPPAQSAPFLLHVCSATAGVILTSTVSSTAIAAPCAPFTMTPVASRWNAVGISSTSDWDVAAGESYSRRGSSACDYIVADGRQGSVSPNSGVFMRFSGSSNAEAQQATVVTVNPGSTYGAAWSSSQIIRVFEFTVPAADDYDINVGGLAGLRWDLWVAQGDSAWKSSSDSADARNLIPSSASSVALPAGTHCIIVTKDAGSGISGSFTVSVDLTPNPVPTLSALSPVSRIAGSSGFTLGVTGSDFVPGARIRWDGVQLATTFVSATSLTATVSASQIQGAGNVAVTVVNPAPGGGISSAQNFTIANPVPRTTSLSPSSRVAQSSGFTVTVNGAFFNPSTQVRFDGTPLATTFVNSGRVTAVVPASLIVNPGTVQVLAVNPAPGGGTDGETFTIAFPTPSATALSPSSVIAGQPGFTLRVSGSNFFAGAVVLLNGVVVPTNFVSSNRVDASISAAQLVDSGTRTIQVRNPAPGGGVSNALGLTVRAPQILTLSPPVLALQPAASTVNAVINGLDFLPTSVVYANSDPLPTTFVNGALLVAAIDTTQQPMMQVNGNLALTVRNSATAYSNIEVLQTGGSSNKGILARDPIAPAPGGGYALVALDGEPNQLYTMIIDLAPVTSTSTYPFFDPAANYSLNIRPFDQGFGDWFALFDGIGLFNPAQPFARYNASGEVTVPGFVLPNPAIGLDLTVQSIYFDPTVPVGYRMTWARHADRL